jgi:hypothetical protein
LAPAWWVTEKDDTGPLCVKCEAKRVVHEILKQFRAAIDAGKRE